MVMVIPPSKNLDSSHSCLEVLSFMEGLQGLKNFGVLPESTNSKGLLHKQAINSSSARLNYSTVELTAVNPNPSRFFNHKRPG